ncbi:MAG TPA: M48 family metalloprotease [Terriglobia bacterium]|nr:M48 family metalloprotease [Terriglobia bacterium]
MRILHRGRTAGLLPILVLALLFPLVGDDQSNSGKADRPPESRTSASVINSIIAGEKRYNAQLREYSPRIETYVEYDQEDTELGEVPRKDGYFLGRLKVAPNTKEVSFIPDSFFDWLRRRPQMILNHLCLDEFAVEPLTVDQDNFDQAHYVFEPVRCEYLGDVRCLAIDVHPREPAGEGAFEGRIWVEDHDYAIVRMNGTRVHPPRWSFYLHFDCWRENLRPGVWLPVYIFSQESDLGKRLRYKAETRLWGYDVTERRKQQTQTPVDASTAPAYHRRKHEADKSAGKSQQEWDVAAEHMVLKRLERAGLIAPPGPVDKVLETVVKNLVITSHLDMLPPVDCRVLLTSSLESFSLAYTIVLSRGLIDVLPDEPSLAMILAHELAHVTLPHKLNPQYAVNGGMYVPDEKLLAYLDFARNHQDEAAADAKGMEFLRNSPYKDNLGQAGLFLRAAADAAQRSPHLFGPHLGNGLTEGSHKEIRMAVLTTGAPVLSPKKVDQIAALPLGSRIQVNAWDGGVAFTDRKAVPLVASSEKMPFQVTPVIPHLKMLQSP